MFVKNNGNTDCCYIAKSYLPENRNSIVNDKIQFINNNDASFTAGNGDCSLNGVATTSNVITVGSYDTKNFFKLAGDLAKHYY